MERWLNRLTSVAFIGLCVVGMALGIQALTRPRVIVNPRPAVSNGAPQRALYQPGERLQLPGVDFSQANHTLVLVVKKGCRYCDESMPFYQKLGANESLAKRTRIVVVAPDDTTVSREELRKYNVRVDQVVQATLAQIKVQGTPTAIVADKAGVVRHVAIGRLEESRQEELTRLLLGGS